MRKIDDLHRAEKILRYLMEHNKQADSLNAIREDCGDPLNSLSGYKRAKDAMLKDKIIRCNGHKLILVKEDWLMQLQMRTKSIALEDMKNRLLGAAKDGMPGVIKEASTVIKDYTNNPTLARELLDQSSPVMAHFYNVFADLWVLEQKKQQKKEREVRQEFEVIVNKHFPKRKRAYQNIDGEYESSDDLIVSEHTN